MVSDDLGNTEVEELARRFRRAGCAAEHEDVGRFDVSVGNAVAMGYIERHEDPFEEPDDFGFPPRETLVLVLREDGLEGGALEPFEHHVGDPASVVGGVEAYVASLDDAGRLGGELGEQGAFVEELLLKGVAVVVRNP